MMQSVVCCTDDLEQLHFEVHRQLVAPANNPHSCRYLEQEFVAGETDKLTTQLVYCAQPVCLQPEDAFEQGPAVIVGNTWTECNLNKLGS
jgi:hypothetical protein